MPCSVIKSAVAILEFTTFKAVPLFCGGSVKVNHTRTGSCWSCFIFREMRMVKAPYSHTVPFPLCSDDWILVSEQNLKMFAAGAFVIFRSGFNIFFTQEIQTHRNWCGFVEANTAPGDSAVS